MRTFVEFTTSLTQGFLPPDMMGGILLVNLMAAVAVLVRCFMADLGAFIENACLSKLPVYPIIQGMTGNIPGNADFDDVKTGLGRLDEFWQAAFEIVRLEDSRGVIFLSGELDF